MYTSDPQAQKDTELLRRDKWRETTAQHSKEHFQQLNEVADHFKIASDALALFQKKSEIVKEKLQQAIKVFAPQEEEQDKFAQTMQRLRKEREKLILDCLMRLKSLRLSIIVCIQDKKYGEAVKMIDEANSIIEKDEMQSLKKKIRSKFKGQFSRESALINTVSDSLRARMKEEYIQILSHGYIESQDKKYGEAVKMIDEANSIIEKDEMQSLKKKIRSKFKGQFSRESALINTVSDSLRARMKEEYIQILSHGYIESQVSQLYLLRLFMGLMNVNMHFMRESKEKKPLNIREELRKRHRPFHLLLPHMRLLHTLLEANYGNHTLDDSYFQERFIPERFADHIVKTIDEYVKTQREMFVMSSTSFSSNSYSQSSSTSSMSRISTSLLHPLRIHSGHPTSIVTGDSHLLTLSHARNPMATQLPFCAESLAWTRLIFTGIRGTEEWWDVDDHILCYTEKDTSRTKGHDTPVMGNMGKKVALSSLDSDSKSKTATATLNSSDSRSLAMSRVMSLLRCLSSPEELVHTLADLSASTHITGFEEAYTISMEGADSASFLSSLTTDGMGNVSIPSLASAMTLLPTLSLTPALPISVLDTPGGPQSVTRSALDCMFLSFTPFLSSAASLSVCRLFAPMLPIAHIAGLGERIGGRIKCSQNAEEDTGGMSDVPPLFYAKSSDLSILS
ncbi:hypothetical protein ADUPG1_006855, partial [Aduncisulcus paluster]